MASKLLATLILVLCSVSGLDASYSPFTACSVGPSPSDFRLTGCTEEPCELVRGTNVEAEWDWTVTADTTKLTPRVRATLYGLTINFPLGQDNACDTLTNAECPLDEGEYITYALSMPVSVAYPLVSLSVEFALLDDVGDVQVCFSVSAKVVSA